MLKLTKIKTIILCSLCILLGLITYSKTDKSPSDNSISQALQHWRSTALTFKFNNYDIAYHDSADTSKELLILIHGYPSSSFDWHLVWTDLSKRYRVIAIDMLGFGFSDKPNNIDYSIALQTDIHESLLTHLGVNAFHILAHDYGDNVAQELLSRFSEHHQYPFDITSVTLLNGGIFPSAHKPTIIQSLLISPLGPMVSALVNQSLFNNSFSKVFGERTKPSKQELLDQWFLICQNGGNKINYKLVHASHDREVNKTRWQKALTSGAIPLLLVAGLQDPVAGLETVEEYLNTVPNPNVVQLNDIGHFPQLEAPERVIQHLNDFIALSL